MGFLTKNIKKWCGNKKSRGYIGNRRGEITVMGFLNIYKYEHK